MRRWNESLARALILFALFLPACGTRSSGPALNDLVFASSGTSVVGLEVASGRIVLDAPYAIPTADWSRIFSADLDGVTSRIVVDDVVSGATRELARPAGNLVPRVVSRSGRLVALASPRATEADRWSPVPRTTTELATLELEGGTQRLRRFSLAGNYEPEAFTTDDGTLVLVEYLPAAAPNRYRLSELDLETGRVYLLGQRIKRFAPAEMRGTGRTQVAAPDGSVLYTLYTRQGPNPAHPVPGAALTPSPIHAFVHVLNLGEGWAHCVDLPDGFGAGGGALAVAPDGSRLVAFDGTTIASLDTTSLGVSHTTRPGNGSTGGPPMAAVAPDGSLFVGGGREILRLDPGTLAVSRYYPLAGVAHGLGVSPDGARLYVTLDGIVQVLDAATGAPVDTFSAPGAAAILHVVAIPGS